MSKFKQQQQKSKQQRCIFSPLNFRVINELKTTHDNTTCTVVLKYDAYYFF